ncbi:hypothetical protein [Amycolatopsis circi]|uniref:hypothetical protein n=1 Tax=Amycolatopsis circi TaxID=871959 RepID=UPI000E24186C|nr:hypothetical protein [Amycolatopsis circi]
MFRRRQGVVQNDTVARSMRKFFKHLENSAGGNDRSKPEAIAKEYGRSLWNPATSKLVDDKRQRRSRFYIGLSTAGGISFAELTKRVALVSDTLLLSHDRTDEYHHLGESSHNDGGFSLRTTRYGMNCPDLAELGRWILDAEPLLKAGLAWYLPRYSSSVYESYSFPSEGHTERAPVGAIDYLISDGRAIDASGAEPIKSQLVRPVLRIDLPFVAGVDLRSFSEITIEEFTSYSSFRDFLRQSLLDMDTALNAVQSDRELLKLGLEIKDHVRSTRSEMETARRKKAVGVTGAVIGSVGATLAAVYGPALQAAIAALGATGGVWGIIHAAAENDTRALRQDTWYYVWALAQKANTNII